MLETGIILSILTGAGSLMYFVLNAWQSDARRTRRVLRRTRVTRIDRLVDGQLACVVGTVELAGEPITSLVTERPCVAFDTTIQLFTGNSFTVPAQVDVTRRLVPFVVRDDTGRVRIDAPQAALCNKPVARSERFEERVIEVGARIRIVGSVRIEPSHDATGDGEHGYREGATTATLTGTAKYPLLIDNED